MHPLDERQAVSRGEYIQLLIRSVDDDARSRARSARLVLGEISR
jgi:hypothetical protein